MSPTCPTEQNAELDCTTCMRCSSVCPAEVDLPEAMRLRRYLDRPRGSHRDLFLLSQKILSTSPMTPWLSPELDVGKDDVYYFPGCLPIMDELVDPRTDFQRAANAGVALLNALGISPNGTRSCGRLGPARLGRTVPRSSSRVSVNVGSGASSVRKRPCALQ